MVNKSISILTGGGDSSKINPPLEARQELQTKLIDLVDDFHKRYPHLIEVDLRIKSKKISDKEKYKIAYALDLGLKPDP
jgi:signal transduction histidine kinase